MSSGYLPLGNRNILLKSLAVLLSAGIALFGLGHTSLWAKDAPAPPTVSSLAPPARTITQGGTSTFTITINAAQPTDTVVTVTSSAPDIAYVPSQVTIPAGSTSAVLAVTANTPGNAQVVVRLNEVSATSTVIVTAAQSSVVSLLPPTNPVLLGATTTLMVTLSAAQAVDTVVQITEAPTGLVTVPSTVTVPAGQTSAPVEVTAVGLGTAMVRASLNESMAEAVVRVMAPAPALVALQPTPLNLASDATSQLTVTLNAAQATETIVALAVDKDAVLQVPEQVVIPAGQLQAMFSVTGRKPGDAVVTAQVGDSTQKVTVQVRDGQPTVVSIVPNPFVLQQAATGNVTVALNAAQSTDTVVSLTNSAPSLLQLPDSVTVPAGRSSSEFAITALAPGTAIISAAATGTPATATVQVIAPLPKVVALTPSALTLSSGTPGVLRVTVSPAPTEPTPVSLASSAPAVAEVPLTVTVPAGSLGAEFPVVTRGAGESTVTATLNGAIASARVTVTEAELMSLALSPSALGVSVGESLALHATGTWTDGTTQDLKSRMTWQSSDQKVASVSSSGITTGISTGSTTVTATMGSLTAQATVTVQDQIGKLNLTPSTATIGVGQGVSLTVNLSGPPANAPVSIALTTSATGTLTVSPSSVVIPPGQTSEPITVTGTGVGTVTLTASASGYASASAVVTVGEAAAPIGPPGQSLTGQVLSATDGKPLAGVQLKLAGKSTTTDANGRFVFLSPPSGYRLVKVDHPSLEQHRKKDKDGKLGGHMHADPVLVNISSSKENELPYPIYVVQTHPTLHPIVPGQRKDIRPTHIPGFTMSIPDGATIKGEDGRAHVGVSVTIVAPDRVPRIPEHSAPRTVYLVSFEEHGGGVSNKPIPLILPNDLHADPGERIELWFYEKSPEPDPQSHQWKMFGYGTVSPDGKRIVPDPGIGQAKFCYVYYARPGYTNPRRGEDGEGGGDPVDLSSGAFIMTRRDLVLPGVMPVTIMRTYRSLSRGIGPFGQGGSMNYDLYLKLEGTSLSLLMPDGNTYLFAPEQDGKYRNTDTPTFNGVSITRFGDNSAELRWRDGTVYAFNTSGWLTAQRDRYNNQITITRDGNNLITSIIAPGGRSLDFTYTTVRRGHDYFSAIASITGPLGQTVKYEYNAFHNGRLSSVTDPEGGVTQYTYGDLSDAYYWAEGMQTIIDPRGNVYLKNEYDTAGRVIRQVLADGSTYTFNYTLAGQTITQTTVTDPRGNTTTHRFNSGQYTNQIDASGPSGTLNTIRDREVGTNKLMAEVDPLNRRTEYTYDANGNVATIKDPENNITTFTYEPTFNRLTQITDAMTPANITTFAYDDVNRRTTITDPEGKQTVIQYNTAGRPTSITDPLTHVTSFGYDANGNLTTTTDALSNVTTRQYDNLSRLVAVIDPKGMLTRFSYDWLNRLIQIQDPLGGLTTFTYDPNGNLLTVSDPKSQTTAYTYDSMDRLLTRKDALNRTEQYDYDKFGNLAKFTDRKNQVATFTYDSLNRRTGANYPDATVTFGYDANGRLTSINDSIGGNITWVYDAVGHHPRVAETSAAGTVTVEYDEIGRRFKLSATGQTDVTYTYDKNSRLKTVTKDTQTVSLAYDDAGRRTSLTYPNGVVTSYGYDNANRLLTLSHVKAPTTIESLIYQYDAAGNRTTLTRANAAASVIPQAVSNIVYDAANEQVRFNSGTNNLTYDSNGNLTSFTDGTGTTTYTWNARNQLVTISGPGLTASFGYDALGRRKSKTVNSVTTGYWYDGRDVLAELNGSTPTATYIRNLSIDEPFIRKGPTDEFYQTDVLGSTLALTDAAGSSQTTYTYEPFGKTTVSGTSTNSFKYTGRENDTDGLYYYRARYYGSGGGRFLQEDPIGISGGLNLYNYVNSNPVNAIDPTGQIAWALPAIPVIAIPAFEALTALGGLAIGAIMSTVGDTPRDQAADDARDREHQAYKDRCGETPPSGLKDECEVWRWKLQRERDCVRMMEEWDRKWRPDLKKNNAIEQRKRGIQRLEKLIETRCGCPKGD